MSTGVLIVGHGSRETTANDEFEALVTAYHTVRPDIDVAHGYVELAHPSLTTVLRDLAQRTATVAVLPLFLFAAGHLKDDQSYYFIHAHSSQSTEMKEFCSFQTIVELRNAHFLAVAQGPPELT